MDEHTARRPCRSLHRNGASRKDWQKAELSSAFLYILQKKEKEEHIKMKLFKKLTEEIFSKYIERKRYNQRVSSSSQDGLYSAGEISALEDLLKGNGVDLEYFRIQKILDGKEPVVALPDIPSDVDILLPIPNGSISVKVMEGEYPGVLLTFHPSDREEKDYDFEVLMEYDNDSKMTHVTVWDGEQEDPSYSVRYN